MIDQTLEASLERIRIAAENRNKELDAMLSESPLTIQREVHHTPRELSRELSSRAGRPAYARCQTCVKDQQDEKLRERIHKAGVPLNLCNATFDNWTPESENDESHLDQCRRFTKARRGFLVMLGDLGTGKGHLAAAITRHFRYPLFIKQSELLRRLRHTYRDKAAVDPVEQAQDADLLVLDEMGLSAGGKDELPMLHDVLDHRYNERKPTVLTGNISITELQSIVGERMEDRLRECAFAVLMFAGNSNRREARDNYFKD